MTHNSGTRMVWRINTEEKKFWFLTGELGKVLKGEIRLKNCVYYPSWGTKFQEVERATESMNILPISS